MGDNEATGQGMSAKCAIFEKTIDQNKEHGFDSNILEKQQQQPSEGTKSDTSSHQDGNNHVGHAPLHAEMDESAASKNPKTGGSSTNNRKNGDGPSSSPATTADTDPTTNSSSDPQQERLGPRKSIRGKSGWSKRNRRQQQRSSHTLPRQTPDRGSNNSKEQVRDAQSIRSSLKVFEKTIEQNKKFGFDGTPGRFRSSGAASKGGGPTQVRRMSNDQEDDRPCFEMPNVLGPTMSAATSPQKVLPKPPSKVQKQQLARKKTTPTKPSAVAADDHLPGIIEASSTGSDEENSAVDVASDAQVWEQDSHIQLIPNNKSKDKLLGDDDDEASDESSLLEPIRVVGEPEEPDFGDSGSTLTPPIPTMIEFTPMDSLPDLSEANSRWSSQQKKKKPGTGGASPVQQQPQSRWSSQTKTSPKATNSKTISAPTTKPTSRWSSAPKKKAADTKTTYNTDLGKHDSRWSSRPVVQKRKPRRASIGSTDGGPAAVPSRPVRQMTRRNSESGRSVERIGRPGVARTASLGAIKQERSATRIQSAARRFLQRWKYKIALMEQKQKDLRVSKYDELNRIQDRVKQEKKEFQESLDREIRMQLISSDSSKIGLDDLDLEETLRKQVADLEKENDELRKQRNRLLGSNRRIKASSESRRDTVKDVSNRLAKLKHINEKLNKVHKEFKAEYAIVEERMAEAETNLKLEKALGTVTKTCIRKIMDQMKSKSSSDDDLLEDLEDLTPLDCLV